MVAAAADILSHLCIEMLAVLKRLMQCGPVQQMMN